MVQILKYIDRNIWQIISFCPILLQDDIEKNNKKPDLPLLSHPAS